MKINVKITPNARKNQIVGFLNDILKIKIAAQPQKGKANKELIKFLAKEWNIPKNSIEIAHGFKSSTKVILIRGLEKDILKQYPKSTQSKFNI